MLNQHKWTYKDGSRYYWTIEAYKESEKPVDVSYDTDDVDWIWGFDLHRDCDYIYGGILKGQLNIVPKPEEFFIEYLSHITGVAIGVAKYAQEDLGT